MFTGLIEETGAVTAFTRRAGASRLVLEAPAISAGCALGESIAVNGCCLTLSTPPADGRLEFDLLEETLERTNLGGLVRGSIANLERALPATGRLGGHFVQGHIDCVSTIKAWEPVGADHRLEIDLPLELSRYAVEKGSIAVDGISLTIAALSSDTLTLWIIPHTVKSTNLRATVPGQQVNLEFDVLAKYVERLLRLGVTR